MTPDDARDDLAFIKALVAPDDGWQQQFGRIYFAAGVCYSTQLLLHAGQLLGVVSSAPVPSLVIGWLPTVIFAAIMAWIILRDRPRHIGGASRAVGTVFASVGLANVALCVSLGSIALRLHSQTIWLIYPVVVMVLQGMAWLVAFMLRRRSWMGVVALGWFLVGIGMAAAIQTIGAYIVVAGIGMVTFMLVPGLLMIRQARQAGG